MSKKQKVILFGTGQIAQVAHYYLTHDSPYAVVAFTVDGEYKTENQFMGLPVIPFDNVAEIYPPDTYKMFLPISYRKVNKLRAEKYYQAKAIGYQLISYISSKANVWTGLVVGDNCFIMENNVVQPFASIGNDVILWSGNLIAHHSVIKDHCFIATHVVVSGSVTIEPYCFLGANATIRDNITIASECVIGAGALILGNTQAKGIYMGNPAQLIPKPSDELSNI
jgi:sugar O-acyltransferase (sialic acid O-acetyltransferase NeuD family)